MRWKVDVKNQIELKINSLMFDNGGEYDLIRFKKFQVHKGIRCIMTVPDNVSRNESYERINRMLNECIRSMRQHARQLQLF